MPPRNPTPDIMADVRAQTPDDASLRAMFGPPADGERIVQIALHALDDNPFQRRTAGMADDDPSLVELSTDIAQHGIHQPLVVRPHPDQDARHGRYQIAAGHRRRLAAHLAGLETVPCVIRPLTDDQMLDVVFSENYHRADINAIDRARLIQLLVDQGMTQQAIADRLSMSRPAVSNALRLLKLPADLQAQVAASGLSARQAEALLSLVDLPPEIKTKAEANWDDANRPSAILRSALAGASSDDTRKRTADLLKRHATPIHEEPWYKRDFPNARLFPAVVAVSCQQCPQAVKRDAGVYCTVRACISTKQTIHGRNLLQAASQAVNIPSAEEPFYDYSLHESFSFTSQRDAILAAEPRCPNLRLAVLNKRDHPSNFATIEGHPGVAVVCQKPGNHCRCLAKARTSGAAPDKTKPAVLEKEIIQPAAAVLADALISVHPGIVRLLGNHLRLDNDYSAAKAPPAVVATVPDADALKKVSRSVFEWHCKDWRSPDLNRAIAAQLLAVAGLRAPWLPPLAEELSARLAALSNEIDDYQSPPDDGLPTLERMAAIMDQINAILDSATANTTGDDLVVLQQLYRNIWPAALALNERVQASRTEEPTP
jgi:ParB/RepB/Spo0J family partition protein